MTVYANATVFFDLRSWEVLQGSYDFSVQGYGNGTLQLRFKGLQPLTVTQSAATNSYNVLNGWQQLTYTASSTSNLELFFGVLIRPTLNFASYMTATAFVLLVISRTSMMVMKGKIEMPALLENKRIFLTMLMIITIIFLTSLLFP